MNPQDIQNILAYRLRKLARSGAPSEDLAARIQELLAAERSQKLPADESQQDFILPFFSGRKAHLNLV